ncbi:Potassium-transporting ATPase ATP-binding subunit [Streptomyces tendae]
MLSDRVVIKITTKPGETFIDRMISLVEGAARQKTPNEIALNILLASLTVVFLLACATLPPFADYAGTELTMVVLVALLVCLIPTTIGALLSAIGIAGMDRLVQRNVLAMSGRAVEAAGDVSTLLLDKTGTITLGNRQAAGFVPVRGTTAAEVADAAQLSSLADRHRRAAGRRPGQGGVRAAPPPPGRTGRRRMATRSPRRPACPAWTWTAGGSARARPVR